ncbi:DUF3846 domain-containing protein [Frigoribacterium sp. 9N]|uniref:DUF3846 domain-containing protein n=1 Tax=Frigoribacterium sp. 9N TaxID=2653144 RepID=UPI0012EF20B5|nr:DUF3846 domain-containing protein [Frigoribacterium sp. 9N]VXB66961.1 conserved hypothetical protein [Frigoribacterium sp. 9N]
MVKGLWVPVDDNAPIEQRELAGLDDYQDVVGGWIEPVDVPSLGVTIYVNEEGLIRQLPLNPRATFLWWFHVPQARQKAMLVGDALLVGMPDRRGESTDVPDAVIALCASRRKRRIEYLTESDARWRQGDVGHDDVWEAMVWGMVLLERAADVKNVRLAPFEAPTVDPPSTD